LGVWIHSLFALSGYVYKFSLREAGRPVPEHGRANNPAISAFGALMVFNVKKNEWLKNITDRYAFHKYSLFAACSGSQIRSARKGSICTLNLHESMIRQSLTILISISWMTSAMSRPQSPIEEFVADKEFCAYMASLPENESETFLVRYQAAMEAAMSSVRTSNPAATDTQIIFSMKVRCDEALNGRAHHQLMVERN
jgi:hypothetical protein